MDSTTTFFLVCTGLLLVMAPYTHAGHGAQVRVTTKGLKYLSQLEAKLMEKMIPKFPIPEFSGNQGPVSFRARNTKIRYLKIGGTSIQTLPNVGLKFGVKVSAAEASTTVSINYHLGFINIGDTTTVTVRPSGVDYNLGLRVTARNGKPRIQATSCSCSIRGLSLNFSGGLGWLYNLLRGFITPQLKNVLQSQMCSASKDIINKEGNKALSKFPTRLPIANLAFIDYSVKQTKFTKGYMDWMLQGEFMNIKRPSHSALRPPSYDASYSSSHKMSWVWVTDYTLNTLGEVFHNARILNTVIPTSAILPPFLKKFLNTATLKDIVPGLYQKYPDRPMEIGVESASKPVFKFNPGGGEIQVSVRAYMKVIKKDSSKMSAFHLDISCATKGRASLKTVSNKVRICGKIYSQKCSLKVGGSIFGDVKLPLDQTQIDDIILGLVVNQVNPLLAAGIPLPQNDKLVLKNPGIMFVKNAVRVGTDFQIRI